jgi:hypothetical protein
MTDLAATPPRVDGSVVHVRTSTFASSGRGVSDVDGPLRVLDVRERHDGDDGTDPDVGERAADGERTTTAMRRRDHGVPDVDADGRPATRFCDLCGGVLRVGQRRRHHVCCAADGGRPGDVCNRYRPKGKDEIDRCAHCWVPADVDAGEQGAAA